VILKKDYPSIIRQMIFSSLEGCELDYKKARLEPVDTDAIIN